MRYAKGAQGHYEQLLWANYPVLKSLREGKGPALKDSRGGRVHSFAPGIYAELAFLSTSNA